MWMKLLKMKTECAFYLTDYDYDHNKTGNEIRIPLIDGKNASIRFRDVLYARPAKGGVTVDLKYNTMTNYKNVTIKEWERFKAENPGFCKGLIWYYEKESRLLIDLKGEAAAVIDPKKDYAVFWEIGRDRLYKYMKITCGPEIDTIDEALAFPDVRDFILRSSRVTLSENAGDVHMNLCSKCDHYLKEQKGKTGEET